MLIFCLFAGLFFILNVKSVKAADEACEEIVVQGIQFTSNKKVIAHQCLTHGINECEDFCKATDSASTVSFEKLCFVGLAKGTCCACLKEEVGEAAASVSTPTKSGALPVAKIKLRNPLGEGAGIFIIMGRVINTFLGVIGAIALLIFIYGGVTYMIAGGEESRVTKARDILKYATIGLVAIILAYVLVNFFIRVFAGK